LIRGKKSTRLSSFWFLFVLLSRSSLMYALHPLYVSLHVTLYSLFVPCFRFFFSTSQRVSFVFSFFPVSPFFVSLSPLRYSFLFYPFFSYPLSFSLSDLIPLNRLVFWRAGERIRSKKKKKTRPIRRSFSTFPFLSLFLLVFLSLSLTEFKKKTPRYTDLLLRQTISLPSSSLR